MSPTTQHQIVKPDKNESSSLFQQADVQHMCSTLQSIQKLRNKLDLNECVEFSLDIAPDKIHSRKDKNVKVKNDNFRQSKLVRTNFPNDDE